MLPPLPRNGDEINGGADTHRIYVWGRGLLIHLLTLRTGDNTWRVRRLEAALQLLVN